MKTYKGIPINQVFQTLGAEPSYDNFIFFVKEFLAPHMGSLFIEEEYYKEIWEHMWTERHTLLQMPRGHSKTELVGVWMTLFFAACQPYNPFFTQYKKEITQQMIIAGDSQGKHAWAERIKHFFYESEYLSWLIPEGADSKKANVYWNDSVMYLKNGHMILLRSIGERAIRGNHVDRLHADDLVTENSTMVDQAIKDKWDGAVDGTTTNKRAMVQVTGTPLRYSDVLFHLQDRGYPLVRMPAILDWDKKTILSPNRWTWENLMETKRRIGSVKFQSEYMLDPIDDSTSLIKNQWIMQCMNSSYDIIKSRPEWAVAVYLGVDFAFEDRVTSNRSAFVIIAQVIRKDEMTGQDVRHYIILDIITRKGMSALEQFEFIKELHGVYNFDMIGVEENSIKAIGKHISAFNLPLKRFYTASRDSKDTKGVYKAFETVGKRNLILRLGTMLEQKHITIPSKSEEAKLKAEELRQECLSFAQEEDKLVEIGVHPDIPIGLAYALEVAEKPSMSFAKLTFPKIQPNTQGLNIYNR